MRRSLSLRCALRVAAGTALAVTICPAAADPAGYHHEPLRHINGRLFRTTGEHLVELPDVNRYCLGCHDGSVGPGRQVPEGPGERCVSPKGTHPVGVPYPAGDPEWAGLDALDPAMFLQQGRMTCASCHAVEAEDHGLVVPLRHSALCLTCHRK